MNEGNLPKGIPLRNSANSRTLRYGCSIQRLLYAVSYRA
jgi:hypothetical protein